MDFLSKLERTVLRWLKDVPHLPEVARRWIGNNIWWITLIGAILSAIGVIGGLIGVLGVASVLGTAAISYYPNAAFITWAIVLGIVALVFSIIDAVLLALAVSPLKAKQKKGWVLLFAVWLVGVISVVVNSILSLNVIGVITGLLFGAIWIAISGYFLFEIHGQFAHTEKSKGVKEAKIVKA